MKRLRLFHPSVLSPIAMVCMVGAGAIRRFTDHLAWGLALFVISLALLALALWVNRYGR